MRKKTSVLLDPDHIKAAARIAEERSCTEAEAIRILLDMALEAEKTRMVSEVLQLKIFYYLRQLAGTRGPDFINEIEANFDSVKDRMYAALQKGISHVGK